MAPASTPSVHILISHVCDFQEMRGLRKFNKKAFKYTEACEIFENCEASGIFLDILSLLEFFENPGAL